MYFKRKRKCKRKKKKLDKIGKIIYDFDFELEKNIYIALLMTCLITEIFDVIKPVQLSITEESLVADVILFGIIFVIIIIPVVLIVLIFAKAGKNDNTGKCKKYYNILHEHSI